MVSGVHGWSCFLFAFSNWIRFVFGLEHLAMSLSLCFFWSGRQGRSRSFGRERGYIWYGLALHSGIEVVYGVFLVLFFSYHIC